MVTRVATWSLTRVSRLGATGQSVIRAAPLLLRVFRTRAASGTDQAYPGPRHGRPHLTGAGHPDSDWLFPGRRAEQPIESDQLAERLNRHGITRAARTAALDALLATVPATVLALLLDRQALARGRTVQDPRHGPEAPRRPTSTVVARYQGEYASVEYASAGSTSHPLDHNPLLDSLPF